MDAPPEELLPGRLGERALGTLCLVFVGTFLSLDGEVLQAYLNAVRTWTSQLAGFGPAAFVLTYAVAVVVLVPGYLMTAIAVVVFGPLTAIIVSSIGGTLGATIAFFIARYFIRDHLRTRLSAHSGFGRLERESARNGALFVAVARIVPVMPGNVLHYAFGVTRVRPGIFIFWSFAASLPGLVVFVLGLDAGVHLALPGTPAVVALAVQVLLLAWAAGCRAEDPAQCPLHP